MLNLTPAACYEALKTRDERFDGVFFAAISSTGVYCRPICPARSPKRENCAFYPTAAQAEAAGYRPCLRCRPERAPGNAAAAVDALPELARRLLGRVEEGALNEGGVEELAAELGVTPRHLSRAARETFGVSPVELAQTQRLLMAKRLLSDTNLRVIDVAFASGFGSLRRFNALMRERYGMTPTQLRRSARSARPATALEATLRYRPPLDWSSLFGFLGERMIPGVEEKAGDGAYRRTAALDSGRRGWIELRHEPDAARVRLTLSAELAPDLPALLERVKRLLDLTADPASIAARLGELAAPNPGLRLPGAFDPFEIAVRVILGQQISVSAASVLAARFAKEFGEPLETPFPALTATFPRPEAVARLQPDDIAGRVRVVSARARAIVALARALDSGELRLRPNSPPEPTVAALLELPGVGPWTAHCVALRALGWPDAFPSGDLALRRAMGCSAPREAEALAEAWRPWRAYAVMHLWKSLERGQPPPLPKRLTAKRPTPKRPKKSPKENAA